MEFPARRKSIGRKWVFKKKANAEGKVEKYKSSLVAKGVEILNNLTHIQKRLSRSCTIVEYIHNT